MTKIRLFLLVTGIILLGYCMLFADYDNVGKSSSLTNIFSKFLFGCLGGFIAEVGHLYTIRNNLAQRFPYFFKSLAYWIITLLMIFCGGVLVVVNFYATQVAPIIAVQIGIMAPLIIHRISQGRTISMNDIEKERNFIDYKDKSFHPSSKEILRGY